MEELADKKSIIAFYKKKGKGRMRKFLIFCCYLVFDHFKVVSTEKEASLYFERNLLSSQSDFGIYFREKLSSPYGLWRSSCLCE